MPPSEPAIRWERLPLVRESPLARDWLQHASAGLSAATIDAYSRAVERYLAYCRQRRIAPGRATTDHLAAYVDELATAGLGRAAQQQRLTAIRLFYAFVVERRLRPDNPAIGLPPVPTVGPSDVTRSENDGEPWVPTEAEWARLLEAAAMERARSRLMLALAYDAALRREELCGLRVGDLHLRHAIVRVSTGRSAGAGSRPVPCSPVVADHLAIHVQRRGMAGDGGALFLSESPRNRAEAISIWTWSKVTLTIARRAEVDGFTGQTPRHLRLVDLARAGHDAAAIARFGGLQRPNLARRYLRLAEERPGPMGPDVERQRAEQLRTLLARAPN